MKNRKKEITLQIVNARCAFIEAGAKTPPQDPDDADGNLNDKRSDWAQAAIVAFAIATGSDLEDAIADLIGDLGHFCDRHGLDMQRQVDRGREFYDYETQHQGIAFDEKEEVES